jgi:hypothetical protein
MITSPVSRFEIVNKKEAARQGPRVGDAMRRLDSPRFPIIVRHSTAAHR